MLLHPLELTLCLTHNCNLRCRYCYAGRKHAACMSWETARAAMDLCVAEAKSLELPLDVSFFGGEPLLEWELLQRCHAYMEERRGEMCMPPRYGITTNCTLLTPEKLAWMAERDFLVGVSVDGSPAMHDINRRFADGTGSHAALQPALQEIRKYPSLRSKAVCVVNAANCHLLAEGVAWLHEHYDHGFGLNLDYWHEWTDEQFDVLCAQLERVKEMVLESYRGGVRPVKLENFEDKIRTHLNGDTCAQCRIGEREIAVSAEGNFFPCSRLVGEGNSDFFNFGNVREGINRARQNYLIATRGNSTPECKLCALRSRCMNGCGCSNYAASGHIDRVSPFLCSAERAFIRLADELAETLYAEKNALFMREFYGGEN